VGGAAHEINNPLTAMLGYSDLLSTSSLPPHEQVLADRIAAQVRRTRTLVSSLLTFVRQSPAQLSGKDVNSIVQTAMRLLAPQLEAEETQVRIECAANLPMVFADSNQLLHVFLHLAGQISGRTRSPGNMGLYVRTIQEADIVLVDLGNLSLHSDSPFQPLKNVERTSKRASLSLGACCRIVEEHGGRILAQPTSDGYSTFRVELPTAKTAPPQAHHTRATAGS
jgi:two-component system NtrC family sensor kinase